MHVYLHMYIVHVQEGQGKNEGWGKGKLMLMQRWRCIQGTNYGWAIQMKMNANAKVEM